MVTEAHFSSCLQLKDSLNSEGIDHNWYTLANESLVQRARNNCAEFFLEETNFEYLMFLDADIEFKPEDVATLYQMEKDVAVGVYRMKKPVLFVGTGQEYEDLKPFSPDFILEKVIG